MNIAYEIQKAKEKAMIGKADEEIKKIESDSKDLILAFISGLTR